MNLSSIAFWDVNFSGLDPEKHAAFIITRVLMKGTFDDWLEIKQIYGTERIKDVALHTRYFDNHTLNFCSVYFNLPKEKFRCYTTRQLTNLPWKY
jgi:hypothetical protein